MKALRNLVKREYLLLSLFFVLGFGFYLYILTRHSLIYGIDGPYYLTQVRSLMENGRLVYGDPPLVFFIFTFFTLLFGGDITLGIRVGVALFSALSAVPLYFWIKKITHSEFSGYIAALASIFSASHIRLAEDFLKNAVGAFFLLCFMHYLHCLAIEKGNKRNLLFAAVFLVLTGVTHILILGIALLFLTLYLIVALLLGVNRKSLAKNAGILLLLILIFGVAAFLAFPSLFSDFSKGLAFFQELFSGERLAMSLFDPMIGILVLPILAVGILLSYYEWRNGKKEVVLAIATVTIVGMLLAFPFISIDWVFRFLLMEFIPIAFIVGYSASKIKGKTAASILLLLCLSLLVLQSIPMSQLIGPTIRETDYRELEYIGEFIPSNSVVAGDLRYGYWLQYITRCNVVSWPSINLWQKYGHVLVLVDKISPRLPPPVFYDPGQPPIPPNSTKIVEGDRFILYELNRP